MIYDLREHRHRFAIWAAARATQRGFTSVTRLRAALEVSTIQRALADPRTRTVTAAEFDALHRQWCKTIAKVLRRRGVESATFGRAATLVAVYLKTTVIMGEECDSPLGRHLHPPIDRRLLQTLVKSERIRSPHKQQWRTTSWTQLNAVGYGRLVAQLRALLPKGAPFWTLEEFWEPSNSSD